MPYIRSRHDAVRTQKFCQPISQHREYCDQIFHHLKGSKHWVAGRMDNDYNGRDSDTNVRNDDGDDDVDDHQDDTDLE